MHSLGGIEITLRDVPPRPLGAVVNVSRESARDFYLRDAADYRDQLLRAQRGLAGELRGIYERAKKDSGLRDANITLRELCDRLKAPGCGFSAAADDDEIKELARVRARRCEQMAAESSGDLQAIMDLLLPVVESHGLKWPADIKQSDSAEKARAKHAGAVGRVCNEYWWRRQFRVTWGRQVEAEMRAAARVRKGKSPYVSKWAFKRWLMAQRRNRDLLESMELEQRLTDRDKAEGKEADVLPLVEAVDASVSDPSNRVDELKTRSRGYEEIAKAMGLTALFLTLTAPSKYHAVTFRGSKNPNFNGATPSDTRDYLNNVFANIRSDWHAEGIRTFGWRMAEPHQDGTPHYHFQLYFPPDAVARAKEIFGAWALREDPNEPGAAEHRWDCVEMDPNKGSATGYLLKYIQKNVNGERIPFDFEGEVDGVQGALRVRAWASMWGIRQFQPEGSASVTVWRELRRRREPLEAMEPQEAEAIRSAADRGEWAEFVELMGGPFQRRQKAVDHHQAERVIVDPLEAVPARTRGKVGTMWRKYRAVKRADAKVRWRRKIRECIEAIRGEAGRRKFRAELKVSSYERDGIAKLKTLAESKPDGNRYGEEIKKIIGLVMRNASRAMGVIITRQKGWRVQPIGEAERRMLLKAALPPPLDLCQ